MPQHRAMHAAWRLDGDGVLREESRRRYCWVGGDWGTASQACAVRMH